MKSCIESVNVSSNFSLSKKFLLQLLSLGRIKIINRHTLVDHMQYLVSVATDQYIVVLDFSFGLFPRLMHPLGNYTYNRTCRHI